MKLNIRSTIRRYQAHSEFLVGRTPEPLYIHVEGLSARFLKVPGRRYSPPRGIVPSKIHLQMGLEGFGGSAEEVSSFFPRKEYDCSSSSEEGVHTSPWEIRPNFPRKGSIWRLLASKSLHLSDIKKCMKHFRGGATHPVEFATLLSLLKRTLLDLGLRPSRARNSGA